MVCKYIFISIIVQLDLSFRLQPCFVTLILKSREYFNPFHQGDYPIAFLEFQPRR